MFDAEINNSKLARQFHKADKQLEIPVRRPLKSVILTLNIKKLRLLCSFVLILHQQRYLLACGNSSPQQ